MAVKKITIRAYSPMTDPRAPLQPYFEVLAPIHPPSLRHKKPKKSKYKIDPGENPVAQSKWGNEYVNRKIGTGLVYQRVVNWAPMVKLLLDTVR